jgi:UDP-3-O-[3-hydroxymyristoyl] glucosamine N-acyltransferase
MSDPVFFEPTRRFSVAEIATLTGAELRTPSKADAVVTAVASLDAAGEGDLVFAEGKRNGQAASGSRATAILCTADLVPSAAPGCAVLVSARPQRDFALVGRLMFPTAARPAAMTGETGVSPAAHVDETARIEAGAIVEPGAIIGPRAAIGSGTVVAPNAVIGHDVQVGRDCHVGAGVTLQSALVGNGVIIHPGARIGQDGFGFVAGRAGPEKMPQLGRVVIQDHVEIGANTAIDRGALGDTVIGEHTKIDNLCQIAHNVRIGRSCLIAAQCGISGSVTLGDGVMMGGAAGVADHLTIGSGAAIAAASGVMHDVPPGGKWGGVPAMPLMEYMRFITQVKRLAKERTGRARDDG